MVGRRQEGASAQHRHHCWSLFLVGFLHPVRWHPPDNDRQCGGEISSSRLVNIRASLQFDIVFNILIIATQVGQHQSQLAVRHRLQHPHHCNSGWSTSEPACSSTLSSTSSSLQLNVEEGKGGGRDQGGAQDTPYMYCEGGQDGGLGGHQLVGGGK